MAFRADESAKSGTELVKNYLISRGINSAERDRSEESFHDIVDKYGPAVDHYPSWHPLVAHNDDRHPITIPSERCGYKGLDHTRCFVNAFISCPYDGGQSIIDSVEALPYNPIATIKAERLDVQMYQEGATPILVSCEWNKPISSLDGHMITASVALPLMLQKEVPCWEWSECGETWETMRPYFLGAPHGSRSSLFVSQETGMTMKKVWNLLINTGMFGDIKVSNQY